MDYQTVKLQAAQKLSDLITEIHLYGEDEHDEKIHTIGETYGFAIALYRYVHREELVDDDYKQLFEAVKLVGEKLLNEEPGMMFSSLTSYLRLCDNPYYTDRVIYYSVLKYYREITNLQSA